MDLSSTIDLVIFDCDGVLIDSEAISASVLIDELSSQNLQVTLDYVREHFFGRSFPTVAQTIRNDFHVTLPEDFELRYRKSLLKRFETELKPTRGVENVLRHLTCAKCVATSSSPERAQRSLAITDLGKFFGEDVFTASQVSRGKPAPDLFLFAASSMGVAPERTLVIEDSAPGLDAAAAAGMMVAYYAGGSHLIDLPPRNFGASIYMDDWTQFPAMLLQTKAGENA